MKLGHTIVGLEDALLELKKLLLRWGFSDADWFLVLHYADILQGYDMVYDRNAHIHVMVAENKIPWKFDKGKICNEIPTPINSRYGRDLQKFIKKTGHDFNLVVEENKYFNDFYNRYVVTKDIKDDTIPMVTPFGNLIWDERYMDKWLKGMTPEIIKRRLEWREFKYTKAIKNGDKKVSELADHFIRKYTPFIKDVKINRTRALGLFKKSKELIGQVAEKGMARGIVFLIENPDAVPKIKKGMIVVAKLTTAKLIPLISNSLAVVTDEGGVLSHASITCREFKIPCIIGTKIATQIFKDGDEVEVDAEMGIVRKN